MERNQLRCTVNITICGLAELTEACRQAAALRADLERIEHLRANGNVTKMATGDIGEPCTEP